MKQRLDGGQIIQMQRFFAQFFSLRSQCCIEKNFSRRAYKSDQAMSFDIGSFETMQPMEFEVEDSDDNKWSDSKLWASEFTCCKYYSFLSVLSAFYHPKFN